MKIRASKVYFITGCSSGLGFELARHSLEAGMRVAATARDAQDLSALTSRFGGDRLLALSLDVTNPNEVRSAVAYVVEQFGQIDVVINNAGYCYLAAVEEGSAEEINAIFDTNLFGSIRVIQAALPVLRGQKSGTIVNVSSVAGIKGFSGMGFYCATKFALEGISQSLREELLPLGIRVLTVNPGGMATNFCGSSLSQVDHEISDYKDSAGVSKRLISGADPAMLGSPSHAAKKIINEIEDGEARNRLILGDDSSAFIALAGTALIEATQDALSIADG